MRRITCADPERRCLRAPAVAAWPRRVGVIVGLVVSTVALSTVSPRPAIAQVTTVTGTAFGYYANVGLFGGPPGTNGPAPTVMLPPEGSAEPIIQTDPDGATAQYGPAVIVQTASMIVSTEGTTGPDGSVTSSALVTFNPDQEQQVDPFNADDLMSTCTATEAGLSGSTVLSNASLVLSTDPETQLPRETVDLPTNPEPNTVFEGIIDHVGDRFRVVLNEQFEEGGTITVNAMHMYLLGDIAIGDAIIGQSVCGVNATSGGVTPTTDPSATETPDTTAPPADQIPGSDEVPGADDAPGPDEPGDDTATAEIDDDAGGGSGLLIGGLAVGGLALVGLVVLFRRRSPG